MAAGTMATAAGAAAMLYYVTNRGLGRKAEEDDGDIAGGDASKSSRSVWRRWFAQSPAMLESMITLSKTLRFPYSVGLKRGGRMEPSESDSAVVSNGKDPELGSEWAPSSTVAHHPQPSDLNHAAEEDPLGEELQNKLDLKGGDGDSRGWETRSWDENVDDEVGGDDGVEKKEEEGRAGTQHHYPLKSGAEDCAFYMKTGTCKFGFNCKFNHPIRRKNQAVKQKAGEREELAERKGQTKCKYYLRSGGCKFGKACKYKHTRGKFSTTPSLEFNFVGLPIRPGKKECPCYMRTGSCKYEANCKFNHPDPTAVGECDPPAGYGNGGSFSLQGAWSSPTTLNETSPFVPMMLSPTRGVSPKSCDWNGYQAPVYLSESSMHPPSTYIMNNPAIGTNIDMHRPKQMAVEEFPGEPECSYFSKTGDCKFKSNFKFHHPIVPKKEKKKISPSQESGCKISSMQPQ